MRRIKQSRNFSACRAIFARIAQPGVQTGAVEPAAGLLGAYAVSLSQLVLPWALSFAAGAMVYVVGQEVVPEYLWDDGMRHVTLLGDTIDPDGENWLQAPNGSADDPGSKLWPFKVHRATQPYDSELNHLLQPVTSGEGGYWNEFDWYQALRLGAEITGLQFSGEYGFAQTTMFWPQTHMVAPKARALQCQACHSEGGRMDWEALGYPGDPIKWGGVERVREGSVQGGSK